MGPGTRRAPRMSARIIASHTSPSSASRAALWRLASDVGGWSRWNPTIAEASLDGPFAEGTTGRLRTSQGRLTQVTLYDVVPESGFVAASRLLGAELRIEHQLADAPGGQALVIERAVLRGPLARVWSLILARQLERDMASGAGALAQAAAGLRSPS